MKNKTTVNTTTGKRTAFRLDEFPGHVINITQAKHDKLFTINLSPFIYKIDKDNNITECLTGKIIKLQQNDILYKLILCKDSIFTNYANKRSLIGRYINEHKLVNMSYSEIRKHINFSNNQDNATLYLQSLREEFHRFTRLERINQTGKSK